MSYTYRLACRPCRVYLWVGQGWPENPPQRVAGRRNIYTSEAHLNDLRDFFYAHETARTERATVIYHDLFFCSSESCLTEDYREVGHDAEEAHDG